LRDFARHRPDARKKPPVSRKPIRIAVLEDTDGVHENAGLSRHFQDLVQFVGAGVVGAIANHNQHFLVGPAGPQSFSALDHRVVECRHSGGGRVRDGFREFIAAIGEWDSRGQAQGYFLVEIDDEHLVLRAAGFNERPCRRDHICKLLPHASAVIDHQSDGDRNIFVPE